MYKFHDVTEDNFNLVVSKLTNKNYMFDPASVSLLASCPATVFPALHYYVCRSFDKDVFPEDLKHATIIPTITTAILILIILKAIKLEVTHHHSAKVLEKAAYFRINSHLVNIQLYSSNQSGYK